VRALALAVLVLPALTGAESSWPLFRGDAAQTGITTTALADRYTLAWTYATGGACSSPVVAGGLAVVASGNGKVQAVDLVSGMARWSADLGAPIEATPLIVADAVIVGSTEGRFVSLALADGRLRWEAKAGDKVIGAANHFVHDGAERVLVGSYDSNIYCFNAADGAEVWKYETGSYVNGTPAIGLLAGRQVAVAGGCDAKLHVSISPPARRCG
jgi:outer membrane protein assembly factor BamB